MTRGGGPGGAGPPLESRIYVVNFLKIVKIWFFLLFGPPLSKNCSPAPGYVCIMLDLEAQKNVKKIRYADQDADYTGSFLKTS